MKNFIKEVLVILIVIVCVAIYVQYFIFNTYFPVIKDTQLPDNSTKIQFGLLTWGFTFGISTALLFFIFLGWQIFSLFRKIQRNYFLLVLSIIIVGFVFYIDNPDIIDMIKYSKEDNGLVIYPPLSALGEVNQPSLRDVLIDELIMQLRAIEIFLSVLCIFLIYKIYQNNQNFAK